MPDTRVGFVGLGNIGRPMAQHLASADGIELSVFDLVPDAVADLEAVGAGAAGSVAELAARCDIVCVMVRDDDQVRTVLAEVLAADGAKVVIIHSTVAPSTPGELATEAAGRGVHVLDAPVSGGAMGASAGNLAVLVGGSDEAFAAARPALDGLSSYVVHAGPIGAGTQLKLARNLMHFVAFTAATEAQRLAEAVGLDLVELGKVVRHTDAITGGPGAIMHRSTTAPLGEDDFWHGVFEHVVALGEKDLAFAITLADEYGVDVPLARLAQDRLAPGLGLPPKEK